jgi:hypothetical protein
MARHFGAPLEVKGQLTGNAAATWSATPGAIECHLNAEVAQR